MTETPSYCNRRKAPFTFFFSLLFILFYPLHLSGNWVDNQLKHLTLEEKAALQYFFSVAIKQDHLGHVLFFSNKPACLVGRSIDKPKSLERKLFLKGWRVWKKHEHLFPHPNFIIYDEIVRLKRGEKALHIYFINKKTLFDCLSLHEEILKTNRGCQFSKEAFIVDLEQKNIPSLFEEDPALVGLMLGFGVESSLAFKQARDSEVIFCTQDEKIHIFTVQNRMLCKLINLHVSPISFKGDPDSIEVKTLRQKYTDELEKIDVMYRKKDLLKTSLCALCGATD